jgi:hypothetical protein
MNMIYVTEHKQKLYDKYYTEVSHVKLTVAATEPLSLLLLSYVCMFLDSTVQYKPSNICLVLLSFK